MAESGCTPDFLGGLRRMSSYPSIPKVSRPFDRCPVTAARAHTHGRGVQADVQRMEARVSTARARARLSRLAHRVPTAQGPTAAQRLAQNIASALASFDHVRPPLSPPGCAVSTVTLCWSTTAPGRKPPAISRCRSTFGKGGHRSATESPNPGCDCPKMGRIRWTSAEVAPTLAPDVGRFDQLRGRLGRTRPTLGPASAKCGPISS